MILKRTIWAQNKPYRLVGIYNDCDYLELRKAAARHKKRTGGRYYIKTFTATSGLWIPETKHALYLSKQINLQKRITQWK